MPLLSWKGKSNAVNFPEIDWHAWDDISSENRLLWGDNGSALQAALSEYREKVNLVYLDPPFCSAANYHQKLDINGIPHEQLAYSDSWQEDDYLQFIYSRLLLLHELLHPKGSIFLHCDPHQSHHLRAILDEIFGPKQFRNEIIWHYTGGGRAKKYFSQKHDTIFWYSKSNGWTFNIDEVRVPYAEGSGYAKTGIRAKSGKVYFPNPKGKPVDDTWDIPIINPMSSERNGYPTQKPRKLLDRIIAAASNPTDLILDPFLGSGTTAEAALCLKRRFVGMDSNINAIHCTARRLLEAGLQNFSIHSSQKISSRKTRLLLKQETATDPPEWKIISVQTEDNEDATIQYILQENRETTREISSNDRLALATLARFVLVFLNGSQSIFQVPDQLSEQLSLSSG